MPEAGRKGGPPLVSNAEQLVVELAGRRFGAPLQVVREVFNLGPLTPVPTAPVAVAGVANLRGQVIPVIDLARLLDLGLHRLRLGDPVVLVEAEGTRIGLLVDRVVGLNGAGAAPSDPSDQAGALDVVGLLHELRGEIDRGAARARAAGAPGGGRP